MATPRNAQEVLIRAMNRVSACLPRGARHLASVLITLLFEIRYARSSHLPALPQGFERIYFYHIRKCGGTSLDHVFMALASKDAAKIYSDRLHSLSGLTICNGLIFGGNKYSSERGNYFYASSHRAAHTFNLPKNTFTITILRDPAARVISHYRMLRGIVDNNLPYNGLEGEKPWLGKSFSDFLEKIDRYALLNQLYMFSANFCVKEAFERIADLSYVLFLEEFAKGIEGLAKRLELPIEAKHKRRSKSQASISAEDMDRLRSMLKPEYLLIDQLREYYSCLNRSQ